MRIEVDPKCTAEEIYHKVRSRWKDRWKVEWEDEEIDQWQIQAHDGRFSEGQERDWVNGERVMLITQPKGSEIINHLLADREYWAGRLQGWKWKRREWLNLVEDNPEWASEWERPVDWLPGERAWFEGDESWKEIIRAKSEEVRLSNEARIAALSEEDREKWRRFRDAGRKEMRMKEQVKELKLLRRQVEWKGIWLGACIEEVEKRKVSDDGKLALWEKRLAEAEKELNQWKSDLEQFLSASGSEGHLPTHPEEV
jgi:hypothetical protein